MIGPGAMLIEFLDRFDLDRRVAPEALSGEERDTAYEIVAEEFREFILALMKKDVVALADACADLIYTAAYAAVKAGIPIDAVLEEVHRSNLTKERRPGPPTGKCVVKGATFSRPQIAAILLSSETD